MLRARKVTQFCFQLCDKLAMISNPFLVPGATQDGYVLVKVGQKGLSNVDHSSTNELPVNHPILFDEDKFNEPKYSSGKWPVDIGNIEKPVAASIHIVNYL